MPPRQIGPYRIIHPLGSGGVGTVYRANDARNNEEVALKLLSTGGALDPNAARRLAREFETLYELNHPNVVRVLDAGVYQGYPYLAMELVEGLDLRRYLNIDFDPIKVTKAEILDLSEPSEDGLGEGGLGEGELGDEEPGAEGRFTLAAWSEEMDTDAFGVSVTRERVRDIYALADAADEPITAESGEQSAVAGPGEIADAPPAALVQSVNLLAINRPERIGRLKDALLQICEALAYVHGKGLVHRDLKPANIMVDDDRRVHLMDFGLAKFLAEDGQVTAGGRVVGTYRYMAPEQLLGEPLDPRADLYSLGVVIYELMTGQVPFSARSPLELAQLVLTSEPPPAQLLNPGVDDQLMRLSHRLLRKEAVERYQTAEEVFQVLME